MYKQIIHALIFRGAIGTMIICARWSVGLEQLIHHFLHGGAMRYNDENQANRCQVKGRLASVNAIFPKPLRAR